MYVGSSDHDASPFATDPAAVIVVTTRRGVAAYKSFIHFIFSYESVPSIEFSASNIPQSLSRVEGMESVSANGDS